AQPGVRTTRKNIGFLSFGHWTDHPRSAVRTASDALLQSVELAEAAEELGVDGAYFRVHHFARQLGTPAPLLAAIGARTRTIEIGTGVVDMRYPNIHPEHWIHDEARSRLHADRPGPHGRRMGQRHPAPPEPRPGEAEGRGGRCSRP